MGYDLVVMGASWGGLDALERVLGKLPADLDAAVAIAQHRSADDSSARLAALLQSHCPMPVVDADDKQRIEPGHVYLAPSDYHLFVENGMFALSMDAAEQYSRPSIDVLFESASAVYRDRVVGVILTGANEDGARGAALVARRGGHLIVQNPVEAERPEMPRAALRAVEPDATLTIDAIGPALVSLCGRRGAAAGRSER